MKTLVRIVDIGQSWIGEKRFLKLAELYRNGVSGRVFRCTLVSNDPVLEQITSYLAREGFQPWSSWFRKRNPNEYWVSWERVYEASDFAHAIHFTFRPRRFVGGLHRDWPGPVELRYGEIPPGADIVCGTNGTVVAVSDQLKQAMEVQQFAGFAFRPIVLDPGAAAQDPCWELTSDRTLGPLSPTRVLWNNEDRPFDGDFNAGCFLKEGLYAEPELHYPEASLAAAGTFDVALTHERFGNKSPVAYPQLVTSKRFFDFCVPQQLQMNWMPVRVDWTEQLR